MVPLRSTTTVALTVVPRRTTNREPAQMGPTTIGACNLPLGVTGSDGGLTLPQSSWVAVIDELKPIRCESGNKHSATHTATTENTLAPWSKTSTIAPTSNPVRI